MLGSRSRAVALLERLFSCSYPLRNRPARMCSVATTARDWSWVEALGAMTSSRRWPRHRVCSPSKPSRNRCPVAVRFKPRDERSRSRMVYERSPIERSLPSLDGVIHVNALLRADG